MKTFFGFALADSMFAADCTIERRSLSIHEVKDRVARGVEWYDAQTMIHPGIRSFGGKLTCRNHPGYGEALEADPLSALSKVEVVDGKLVTDSVPE